MATLVHQWFGKWINPNQRIESLEAKGSYEAAWKLAAREQNRHLQDDPLYIWTWVHGEDSLRMARLALKASGYERAWYNAMHALALFDWKGLPSADPMRAQAESIVQTAELEIHQLRLLDLKSEMQDHLVLYDKENRLDQMADLALQYGMKMKKMFRGLGSGDLHGRWP